MVYNDKPVWKVYQHVNKINGKIYVGITCRPLNYRSGKNGSGYAGCPIFYAAIQKYGWENFKHTIIQDGLYQKEAEEMERMLITCFDLTNKEYGYNYSEGGLNRSCKTGENHPMYGKHHTAESNEKNRLAHFGKKLNLSEEERERRRHSLDGKRKTVPVIHLDTGIWYPSMTEAINATGVPRSSIKYSIRYPEKKTKTHWRLADLNQMPNDHSEQEVEASASI